MQLHELAQGPLGLIIQHLTPQDRARLALTCRAGRRAALAAPVEQELILHHKQLAGFNTWLCRRIVTRAGALRAVTLFSDEHGRAMATACLLARCGTRSLRLWDPSLALLEAACTVGSLTRLELSGPPTSLNPLGALRQLQSLQVECLIGDPPPAWRPVLTALTQLVLEFVEPCTISLDGCSILRQVDIVHVDGLELTASQPLPQLTRLELWHASDMSLPWQQLPALRELVVGGKNDQELVEGATHLTSLRDMHVEGSSNLLFPPGGWLAGVTRLVLEGCHQGQDPASLHWAPSATGVEELVLWLRKAHPPAQHIDSTFKWVRWAAGLPRLRLVELRRDIEITSEGPEYDVLCKAARAKGEGVHALLQRVWWDMTEALLPRGS